MDQGHSSRHYKFGCMLIIFTIVQLVSSYNLEDRLPLFKYGPSSSMFGFSVAQHRISTDDSSGARDTLLVVGGPTAEASILQRSRNTPRNPGGIFYCPVTTNPKDCARVNMDAGGDTTLSGSGTRFIKSNQWLGVSLMSQGPGKFLISCAHRFTQHLYTGSQNEVERVCGKCFLLNATDNGLITEVPPNSASLTTKFISSPCAKFSPRLQNQKHLYAYAQSGASIAFTESEYILGAPGTWAWSGAMFDIDMPTYSPTTPLASIFDEESGRPDMYQTPTCYNKEKDSSSLKCDKLPLMRDSYMGLSVATSNAINPGSNEVFYAAGAPRGNHTGAVVFFRKNTDSSGDITLVPDPANVLLGETIGSSFGYAIALTDINGDGLDDLIVGAPQYYEYSNQNKRGGAVYIYLNGQSGMSNVEPQVIYGQPDSYFGHSVAALGDIDQDGYNDFAVGAPYENENGVVHIFRGSNEGKPIKAQVVNAIDYTKLEGSGIENIVGFGASLSGQVDADSNKYPDLLIGTLSDQVALLRTRPIISVNMSFDISLTEIDLEDKNCSTPGGNHACFDISYCFVYHARHDEYSENVDITYKLTLDSIRQDELKSPRVNFHTIDGPSVIKRKLTLPKAGEKVCPEQNSHLIFFNNGAEDKLSDIGLKMEFDLDLDEIEREKIGEEIFNMIKDPILDADLDKEKQKIVRIKTSCGDDGCQSDLKLSASMPEEVVVGDESELPVKILVVNDGEEAHQSFLTVLLPPNIDFNNYTVEDQSSRIVCYPTTSDKLSFIKCDLGNPYKPETKDEIKIILGVSRLTPQDKLIELEIKGSTSSENPDIAPILLKARVMIELDISLNVFAQPEQVWYREKEILGESGMQTTEDIGPLTVYTFNVINQGSQPASGIVVNIDFPMEINNGKWLLYLVASDVIAGSPVPAGTCSGNYVNVLQLDPRLQAPANIRSKRETESYSKIAPEAEVTASGGFISKITFACNKRSTRCVNIKCNLDEIESQSTTSVILQIHVWEPTFLEEFTHVDLVHIQTQISLASSIENVRFKGNKTHGMVQTTVDHDFFKTDIRSTFPWWYILLAIIALLLIYILVIFILLKCGFFRRKRYSHTANDEDDSKVVLEEVRKRDADEGTEI